MRRMPNMALLTLFKRSERSRPYVKSVRCYGSPFSDATFFGSSPGSTAGVFNQQTAKFPSLLLKMGRQLPALLKLPKALSVQRPNPLTAMVFSLSKRVGNEAAYPACVEYRLSSLPHSLGRSCSFQLDRHHSRGLRGSRAIHQKHGFPRCSRPGPGRARVGVCLRSRDVH